MSQGASNSVDTSAHGPVMADELALELASGRVEYVAKLIIAALTKDPYLRSPISDDWSWAEMRPFIQRLVDQTLVADGAAARRWREVSQETSRALGMRDHPPLTGTETARILSDVGTHLMNVLMLIDTELSA